MKDSSPEKWVYKEHTRVKHELLRKYLYAWVIKLGKFHRKVIFFDGFAGRGEYIDEKTGEVLTVGSPIIALRLADELLQLCEQKGRRSYFDKFICIAIEKGVENFRNLQPVVDREKEDIKFKDKIDILLINDEFANVVSELVEQVGVKIAPSFFFIDPFGFSGVPFEAVKNILSLPRTEIFFTFMSRDINRFLELPQVEKHLDALYPTSEWREICRIIDWQERDRRLLNLYIKSLYEEAGVKYVWPFRVCMDEKYQTLYYLIHATNHFDGLKIMKGIMYKQGASGEFAWLGPKESFYRRQQKLFDDTIPSLKKYLLNRFKGETKTFDEILEETYADTRFVEPQYRQALKELEKEKKIKVERVTSKTSRGLGGKDKIIFPKSNPVQMALLGASKNVLEKPQIKIYYKEYMLLHGTERKMVSRVGDGSIIKRFDKTQMPKKKTDVVCPHFIELKWAYGCPYDCAWCYLKGTFRFRPEGTSPVVKPYEKIELHTRKFLEEVKTPEILNTGEIADSLMYEHVDIPFSKFIIPIFEEQNIHKVLFLTKSSNVKNLLEIEPHNQAIISFSLNAIPVADRWEKAPHVLKRIEAAKKVFDAGYEVRVRIDPMVPIENWQKYYLYLLEIIFENLTPERITLGSLRGLQSTINGCTDKTWVRYLKESSSWGKKIDFKTRYNMYSTLIQELKTTYKFDKVALCKETIQMWDALKMDWKKIRCNCVW
ncbi:MAG: three-Cys-motif partner protein TcmP [Candidatus Marinimicrobia bacterium]|nr:three-Cys-motif partner protein TcmP [Candidatus Neomarinimicrobiota bacterium]